MAFVAPAGMEMIQPVSSSDISVMNVTKRFGDELAVNDISFEVPHGSIFGFIGPSGSGKTTTIRMLTGVYYPNSGDIKVLGKTPTRFSRGTRARLGYMPQLFVLYPHLTVWENMNFAASLYGMSFIRGRRLKEALDFVELYEHRWKLARQISGGMQRRLSLAATLIHNPDLIFLDEPTAGIDPMLRSKFWDRFRELQAQGTTLFITTQYVNEANNCDLVGIMSNGKLLAVNTPVNLRKQAYGGEVVDLRIGQLIDFNDEQALRNLPFVRSLYHVGPTNLRIAVDDAATAIPAIIEWTRDKNIQIEAAEEFQPPFEEVFIELVRQGENNV